MTKEEKGGREEGEKERRGRREEVGVLSGTSSSGGRSQTLTLKNSVRKSLPVANAPSNFFFFFPSNFNNAREGSSENHQD